MTEQDDPADSFLALHDQPLRVRELASMELPHAYLAYLSAASTATGSVWLADESIHIASAFQLAGYTHTIATLWPIPDRWAFTIARQIYQNLVAGTPPAQAVHEAVRSIRDNARTSRHTYLWANHVHFGP